MSCESRELCSEIKSLCWDAFVSSFLSFDTPLSLSPTPAFSCVSGGLRLSTLSRFRFVPLDLRSSVVAVSAGELACSLFSTDPFTMGELQRIPFRGEFVFLTASKWF